MSDCVAWFLFFLCACKSTDKGEVKSSEFLEQGGTATDFTDSLGYIKILFSMGWIVFNW